MNGGWWYILRFFHTEFLVRPPFLIVVYLGVLFIWVIFESYRH